MNKIKNSALEKASCDPKCDEGARFARLWIVGFLLLHFATAPLWGWTLGSFPRVSFLPETLRGLTGFDLIFVGPLIVAAFALLWKPDNRSLWWWFLVPLGLLVLLDQHRLQPWVYQTLIYGVLLGSTPWRQTRPWVTAVAISVYFYSSIGKLDYQFVHTVGRDMVATLLTPVGDVTPKTLVGLAFALPISELLIAILLTIPRTRSIGGSLALGMHATLILLLGPWAMNHSLGVLLWNALLAAQAWMLFIRSASNPATSIEDTDEKSNRISPRIAQAIAFVVLLAPLSERHGWWDHWTSWALYSPHNSRAEIQIHASATEQLPAEAQAYLVATESGDGWQTLDFESWSLESRRVPIYPQARYQVGFGYELARLSELGGAIRVTRKSVSDRWTGKRSERRAIGMQELERMIESSSNRDRFQD
ncbi:MAG: hypothetical protein AAFX06_00310 [Planctomycetota bacterium]